VEYVLKRRTTNYSLTDFQGAYVGNFSYAGIWIRTSIAKKCVEVLQGDITFGKFGEQRDYLNLSSLAIIQDAASYFQS